MNSALNYRVVKSMQVLSFFSSYSLVYLDHSVVICCLCLLCLSSLVERGSGSRRSKRKSDDDSNADADSPKSKVKKKNTFPRYREQTPLSYVSRCPNDTSCYLHRVEASLAKNTDNRGLTLFAEFVFTVYE